MKDPLNDFEGRIDDFLLYLDTAFQAKPWSVNEERRELLLNSHDIFQVPFLEPIPDYKKSDITTKEGLNPCLPDDEDFNEVFNECMRRGLLSTLPEGANLYQHQTDMVERVLKNDEHGVVTSGTGSGKTEAFLMPILYHIFKELYEEGEKHPAPKRDPRSYDWWMKRGDVADDEHYNPDIEEHQERYHESKKSAHVSINKSEEPARERTPGMRALIIYPMNALVEDQMRRLRLALDSKEMHNLYEEKFNGYKPRIARYSGATIGGTKEPADGSESNEKEKVKNKDERIGIRFVTIYICLLSRCMKL